MFVINRATANHQEKWNSMTFPWLFTEQAKPVLWPDHAWPSKSFGNEATQNSWINNIFWKKITKNQNSLSKLVEGRKKYVRFLWLWSRIKNFNNLMQTSLFFFPNLETMISLTFHRRPWHNNNGFVPKRYSIVKPLDNRYKAFLAKICAPPSRHQ